MKGMILGIVATSIGLFIGIAMGRTDTQSQYTILITRNPPPAQIIGRIDHLAKSQAEREASQLNETFTREKSEWRALAVSVDVERSSPDAKH